MMKNTRFVNTLLIAAGILLFALMGCQDTKNEKQPFVVERQQCVLQHMVGFIPSHDIDVGMTVDCPVGGDQAVLDSVMRFVNEAVYGFLESGYGSPFKLEEVYCADGKELVKRYYDAYKPFISDTCYESDGVPGCFCEPEYMSVTMLDQTDAFVTYEIGTLYLGEGASCIREWFTFNKSDGRGLQHVITTENLLRFFKEHPEEKNELYGMMEEMMEYGEDIEGRSAFGLAGDKVYQQFRIPGDLYDAEYDLEVIRPYLTEEARSLFSSR